MKKKRQPEISTYDALSSTEAAIIILTPKIHQKFPFGHQWFLSMTKLSEI